MPSSRPPILESKASRHNMVLVRNRENGPANQPRPVHIVPTSRIVNTDFDKQYDAPKSIEEITNDIPWEACCGVVFAPGAAEPMEWGSEFEAHAACINDSENTTSFIERMLREARDTELRLGDSCSHEDMEATIEKMNKMFANRDRHWVCDDEGDFWTYGGSFGGAFPGDRIQPREVDIGLDRLTVQIPFPGTVYIHSCGVRDGCPEHITRTTTFAITDLHAITKSLSMHEEASTSFDIDKLASCLIHGPCSKTPVYWN